LSKTFRKNYKALLQDIEESEIKEKTWKDQYQKAVLPPTPIPQINPAFHIMPVKISTGPFKLYL